MKPRFVIERSATWADWLPWFDPSKWCIAWAIRCPEGSACCCDSDDSVVWSSSICCFSGCPWLVILLSRDYCQSRCYGSWPTEPSSEPLVSACGPTQPRFYSCRRLVGNFQHRWSLPLAAAQRTVLAFCESSSPAASPRSDRVAMLTDLVYVQWHCSGRWLSFAQYT